MKKELNEEEIYYFEIFVFEILVELPKITMAINLSNKNGDSLNASMIYRIVKENSANTINCEIM